MLSLPCNSFKTPEIQNNAHIIDIGGGASTLVDDLLAASFQHVSVLDVSAIALKVARQRLGARADTVSWVVGRYYAGGFASGSL